jgi:hypothetical protein
VVEVYKQGKVQVRCAQVVDALGAMAFSEVLYAFDFYQEAAVDD